MTNAVYGGATNAFAFREHFFNEKNPLKIFESFFFEFLEVKSVLRFVFIIYKYISAKNTFNYPKCCTYPFIKHVNERCVYTPMLLQHLL